MIVYCTHCWREVNSEAEVCPGCEADLTLVSRTYEEKLIGVLVRPLPEARVRICWLIGENQILPAMPRLIKLVEEDPDLFVRRAAVESLGTLRDLRSVAMLRTIILSESRFLAAAARKSLDAMMKHEEK